MPSRTKLVVPLSTPSTLSTSPLALASRIVSSTGTAPPIAPEKSIGRPAAAEPLQPRAMPGENLLVRR